MASSGRASENVKLNGVVVGRRGHVNYSGTGISSITDDAANDEIDIATTGSGSSAITVQDEGSTVGARATINFTGAGVTATDDAGNNRVNIDIPGGGGGSGHTIKEDGTPLTARAGLNFANGLVATDDAGNDETDVAADYATTTEITDVAAAEAAGTSPKLARGDHVHAHGSGYLPNAHHAQAHGNTDHTTGVAPTAIDVGDAAAEGASAAVARADHTHSVPAPTAGYPLDVAAAEDDGLATTPARSDHVHAHGSGYLPNAHHNQAHAIDGADHTGTLSDAQIPATIARDTEVTTAISDHEAAADPHTAYQRESEKGQVNGYASLDAGGTVPDAQIPATIARDSELHSQSHGNADHTTGVAPTSVDIGDAAAEGSNAAIARADHVHSVPAPGAGYPLDVAAAEADGAATTPARSDHVHAHGSGYLPNAHHNQSHSDSDHTVTRHTIAAFSIVGAVSVGTGRARWYNDTGRTLTLAKVRVSADPGPTGAALIIDVHKDGTTVYTTQANRPQVAAGANTGTSTNPDVTTIADGAYYTIDVDQVGSTVAGSNLAVLLYMTG